LSGKPTWTRFYANAVYIREPTGVKEDAPIGWLVTNCEARPASCEGMLAGRSAIKARKPEGDGRRSA
jgi:hypothetical protein